MLEERDQIVDIVVEIETAGVERDQLRVAPVGDVDVVAGEHPPDRAAQQGCVVAGHRRDDEELGPALHAFAAEALQLPERLPKHDLLGDRHRLALDDRRLEAELRLAARRRRMGEHIERGRDDGTHAAIGEGIGWVLKPAGADVGEGAGSGEQRPLHFIGVVKHLLSTMGT